MQISAVIPRPCITPLQVAIVKAAAKRAALPFAVSRAGLLIVTMLASGGLPDLTRWRFWDGAFYSAIAAGGYASPGWYAWFPLWPLIERISSRPFAATSPYPSMPTFYTGFVLANVLCFAACTALEVFAPVRPHSLPISALLLASPFAFFLAAPYTEPLFLLLAVGVFLALKHEAFGWAMGCAALASATHPTGAVLAVPILLAWLRARGALLAVVPVALASISGLLAYMVYCLYSTGDMLAFYRAEHVYQGRALTWPWVTLGAVAHAVGHLSLQFAANGAVVGLAFLTLGMFVRRIPLDQLLYTVGVLAPVLLTPILTSPDPLVAGGRYMLAAFPLLLPLHAATARRHWLGMAALFVCALAQAGLALFELRHGWLP